MRYWFGIFGKDTKQLVQQFDKLPSLDQTRQKIYKADNWALFVNETTKAHIASEPVSFENGKIIISLHGLPIPKNFSLDAFVSDYQTTLTKMYERNKNDLRKFPLEFDNGKFVGLMIRPDENRLLLFNSYLNHLPLYFFVEKHHLFFSTSLTLLVQAKRKFAIHINTTGLAEYLLFGTNITEQTIVKDVFCLPKVSVLEFNGKKLIFENYYQFPQTEYGQKFEDCVENTKYHWEAALARINSSSFNYGIGLTGGVDSRFILANWPDKKKLKLYTGTYPKHIDYLNAKLLCQKVGCTQRHNLEDYSMFSRREIFNSFLEYLNYYDNALNLNSIVTDFQQQWRKREKIDIQLNGYGGETLGGEHYYTSRDTVAGVIRQMLPFRFSKLKTDSTSYLNYISLGLRNDVFEDLSEYLKNSIQIRDVINEFLKSYLVKVINEDRYSQNFLERFRALYKYSNLLEYDFLGAYNFFENISPYFSISFFDYIFKLPLNWRNDRKLTFQIFNRYFPEYANVVLTGTTLKPATPFAIYKFLKPIYKGLLHYNFKIPFSKFKPTSKYDDPFDVFLDKEILQKVKYFIGKSNCLNLDLNILNTINSPKKMWRLFMVAVAEEKFFHQQTSFEKILGI